MLRKIMKYIFYEDIPKEEREKIRKEVFKEKRLLIVILGAGFGLCAFFALNLIDIIFQIKIGEETVYRFIQYLFVLTIMALFFNHAILNRIIIREVEKRKNS
jgi:hypothetical protein